MRNYRPTVLLAAGLLLIMAVAANGAEIDELQNKITNRQQEIENLREQAERYAARLRTKQQERRTLANQLAIIADEFAQTQLKIESAELAVEKTNLEITGLEEAIALNEAHLEEVKTHLGALLRYFSRVRGRSALHSFFTSTTFSDFYAELQRINVLQQRLDRLLVEIAQAKVELAAERELMVRKQNELVIAAEHLNEQRLDLEETQSFKKYLLDETRSSEALFAELLQEAKREQQALNQEVLRLEEEVRQRLRDEGIQVNGPAPRLIWPVPKNKITASFRDPTYPLRHLFEHDAVDIRAAQGTTVRAAAAGYVAKVRAGNPKNTWYIVLLHEGEITTVYLHLSKILVSENTFVSQGQVIAASGGAPGTPGAGPYTTGPHLHFEVRQSGAAVNPLSYLP